jgi:hypothetical protein
VNCGAIDDLVIRGNRVRQHRASTIVPNGTVGLGKRRVSLVSTRHLVEAK